MTDPRVLIVDDDGAMLEALPAALRLRMPEIVVETVASAEGALALMSTNEYDAIVTDIKMPGMDGLALLDEIRQIRPDTPTLLITGHGEDDLTVQALRGGAYDFIQKPIDRDYFFASLNRAIQKYRLAREVSRQRVELEQHVRVLEHVDDGVFLVDGAGVIRLWNSAAATISGLGAAEVLGRRVEEVLAGWTAVAPRVPVTTVPGSEEQRPSTLPIEIRGKELWISISGVEFVDGVVYAFRDMTAAQAIAQAKDEFVATVSHELRTPLTSIYGAAKTLQREDHTIDGDNRTRLLSMIADEADRLARVVNEILLASQLDAGRVELAAEVTDAVELGRGVLEALEGYAGGSVQLSLVAPESIPPVTVDPGRLRQVLINLIENAIKYSPGGGSVELQIEASEGRLRFEVRDEGVGIAPLEQRRIFDKFYRADPSLSRGVGGTGLGLYICRELVRRMQGRISVLSEQGKGSTFVVDLPLVVAEPAPARLESQPA